MKLLSRKVIASSIIFATATLFVWHGKISGMEWVSLAVATVIAYIAGEGVSTAIKFVKNSRLKSISAVLVNDNVPFMARLKNLFNAQFISAMVVYAVATYLMWNAKISTTEWNYVAIGTIVGYDVLNPLDKLRVKP